jgi:hypothetical protein
MVWVRMVPERRASAEAFSPIAGAGVELADDGLGEDRLGVVVQHVGGEDGHVDGGDAAGNVAGRAHGVIAAAGDRQQGSEEEDRGQEALCERRGRRHASRSIVASDGRAWEWVCTGRMGIDGDFGGKRRAVVPTQLFPVTRTTAAGDALRMRC